MCLSVRKRWVTPDQISTFFSKFKGRKALYWPSAIYMYIVIYCYILFFMLANKFIIWIRSHSLLLSLSLLHLSRTSTQPQVPKRSGSNQVQSNIRCSLIAKRATSFKKLRSKDRPAKTGHLGWSGGRIATEPEEKPIRDVTPAACQAALGQGTMAWRNKPINGAIMNANAREIKGPVSLIQEQRI